MSYRDRESPGIVERLEHIVNWFDKYLLGKSMPQYDLPATPE